MKLDQYISIPNFDTKELSSYHEIIAFLKDGKRKEAYDILYKMLVEYDDQRFKNKKARYVFIHMGLIYMQAEMWEPALQVFGNAMKYADTVGNPFLHLKIGQIGLKLEDERIYNDNLARALIIGGVSIFENEDSQGKEIALALLDPPVGGWESYEGQDWSATM